MNMDKRFLIAGMLILSCTAPTWGEEVPATPTTSPAAEQEKIVYQVGINGYLRGEAANDYAIGDSSYAPQHREERMLGRFQPYIFWKPLDYFSFRVEGQGYGIRGGHDQDMSRGTLYQGYFDLSLPGSELVSLRAGRQEFVYGSGFILQNDTFNDGLSFDALRLQIKPIPALTIDILGGDYVSRFADDRKGDLVAIYGNYAFSDSTGLDLYTFRDTGIQEGRSNDTLYIWGARLTTKLGPVSVEFEPVYETGSLHSDATGERDDIEAYGGHLDLNMENEWHGLKNMLFLGYAMGSGSKDAVDGTRYNKEFKHPNSNASFSELISVVGDLSGLDAGNSRASGIESYSLGFGTDLMEGLNFTVNNHFFRAQEVPSGFSKDIGLETTSYLTWSPVDSVSVIAAYTHLFAGGFLHDATGSNSDVDIAYLTVQFDLSHKKTK